jgi:hypothetical protein
MMQRLILVPFASLLLSGQSPENLWQNLNQLRPGQRIEVVDGKMKSTAGTFSAVTEEGLSLQVGKHVISIPRANVFSVKDRTVSHRGRNTLIGLAVGAGAGLAIGAIKGATYHEEGETAVFVSVWTPIGAGIGATAGATLPSRPVTIYRRPAK